MKNKAHGLRDAIRRALAFATGIATTATAYPQDAAASEAVPAKTLDRTKVTGFNFPHTDTTSPVHVITGWQIDPTCRNR